MDDLIRRYDALGKAQWIGAPATWDDPWPEGKEAVTVEDIEAISAVDAVEVVHGEWVWDGYIYDAPWQCSECRKFNDIISNYCPNCGARMDKNIKK